MSQASYSESRLGCAINVENTRFSEMDMEMIMADEKLSEIARSDPRRAKRLLANRRSALRSKERKLNHISELEGKVETMQSEQLSLVSQVLDLQDDNNKLIDQINLLKLRVRAMEQEDHLRNDMKEETYTRAHHLRQFAQLRL